MARMPRNQDRFSRKVFGESISPEVMGGRMVLCVEDLSSRDSMSDEYR